MRIELEPNLPANAYAEKVLLKSGDRILFGGPVVFDSDPPRSGDLVHVMAGGLGCFRRSFPSALR